MEHSSSEGFWYHDMLFVLDVPAEDALGVITRGTRVPFSNCIVISSQCGSARCFLVSSLELLLLFVAGISETWIAFHHSAIPILLIPMRLRGVPLRSKGLLPRRFRLFLVL